MFLLSSPFFLSDPFLASSPPFFYQLCHPLLLLQLFFLLPKRVASDETLVRSKQYMQHHHPLSDHPLPLYSHLPHSLSHHSVHHHSLLHSALPVPQLGCFRFGQPLCCEKRNVSCKSMDHSGRSVLSFVPSKDQPVSEVRFGNYCIGRVILPNLVALNERGAQILNNLGQREHFRLKSGGERQKKVAENFNERDETVMQFGNDAQIWERMGIERRQMDDGQQQAAPVVRYSLLSRYLPLRIVKRRIRVEKKKESSHKKEKEEEEDEKEEEKEEKEEEEKEKEKEEEEDEKEEEKEEKEEEEKEKEKEEKEKEKEEKEKEEEEDEQWEGKAKGWAAVSSKPWPPNVLTESAVDCFCDEQCTEFGDCCSNYAQACPAIDCEVSEWSEWTECFADNGHCGVGTRERRRTMVRESQNAGQKCPQLTETVACFKQCQPIGQMSGTDLTTVALLLDYHFSNSRRVLPAVFFKKKHKNLSMGEKRQNAKATHFIQKNKWGHNIQYCVHYRIVWRNDQCTDQKQWRTKLSPGKIICAECQPEAQFHRSMPRCASDLVDGQSGFWKLIGPKYCYGIWHRLYSSGNDPLSLGCSCSKHFPRLVPFLLV